MHAQKTCLSNLREARIHLNKFHILYPEKPFIQLAVESSHPQKVFLQLQINDKEIVWNRITWMGSVSIEALLALIEIEHEPLSMLDLCHESGSFKPDKVKKLLDAVKDLKYTPILSFHNKVVLDGESYTLTTGFKGSQTTFKWDFFPDENKELQNIADLLEELNARL